MVQVVMSTECTAANKSFLSKYVARHALQQLDRKSVV